MTGPIFPFKLDTPYIFFIFLTNVALTLMTIFAKKKNDSILTLLGYYNEYHLKFESLTSAVVDDRKIITGLDFSDF